MLWRFVPVHWWKAWGPVATTSFLSLVLLFLGDGRQLGVVRALRNTVLYPASALDASLRELWTLRGENERLLSELVEARVEAAQAADLARENARLLRLLGFAEAHPDTFIAAKVIGRAPAPTEDWGYLTVTATVPAELDDHHLVAITPEGLAGHVIEREPGSMIVASLASSRSAVPVTDQRSGVAGVVRAEDEIGSRFRMDHVPAQEDVAVGDTLITSGYGRVFPHGIPVGRVSRVEEASDALIRRVWVEPFVRFSRLEEVFLTPGQRKAQP